MTCKNCGATLSSKNVKCDCERKRAKVDPEKLLQKDKRFIVSKKTQSVAGKAGMGAEPDVITKEEKENATKEANVYKPGSNLKDTRKDNPETDALQD